MVVTYRGQGSRVWSVEGPWLHSKGDGHHQAANFSLKWFRKKLFVLSLL